MATVYLAEDLKHHRKVAVKVLRPELGTVCCEPERFLQEIEIAAGLTHPHILPLHDSGEADGLLYYVMPYVEGESVRDRLNREKQLPVKDALQIAREVATGLNHAHKHGVVHRDIKPENILLPGGTAVVADFGIAHAVTQSGGDRLTQTGIAVGTPAYMSPEQASADIDIDGRSDLYALGCVLYEMLAGQPPFTGPTVESIVRQHIASDPPSVAELRPKVAESLTLTITKTLAKAPADRFQTAEELGAAVAAEQVSLLTPSGGSTPAGTTAVDRMLKRRWMMLGGAVGVVAVIAVIVVMAAFPRGSTVALDPDRVVVAVFDNESGESSLDQLGKMAAHWITQGLQQTGFVHVLPWQTALQSWLHVRSEAAAGRVLDPVGAVADETGAGIVISGSYYLEGNNVRVQVDVNDAVRQRLLGSIDPLIGSRDSTSDVVGRLQQQVMGFLALRIDERLAAPAELAGNPPPYEAYEAFDEGMERFLGGQQQEAQPFFRRAIELDSTYAEALMFLTFSHFNNGELAQADSVLNVMEGIGERLTPYYRAYWEYMSATLHGDLERGMLAIRRAAEMAPGSRAWYNRGLQSVWTNRPREAFAALSALDPERGAMRGWSGYWTELTAALHMLGEHERELEVARRAGQLFPNRPGWTLGLQARALGALGRIEELNSILDQMVRVGPPDRTRLTSVLAVQTLRSHGHIGAADDVLSDAIDWFEARPPAEAASVRHRESYGDVLFLAGRKDGAQRVFDMLVSEFPDSDDMTHRGRVDLTHRGRRGFIAAVRGDTALALADERWLADLARPHMWGNNTFYRGVILGALGQQAEAVMLLRQSFNEGKRASWLGTAEYCLAPLRDYPPFQELMRPKG
jgi:tetratricopeptide (TPR) repeat protein